MKLKKVALALFIVLIAVTSSISYGYFTGIITVQGNSGGMIQKLAITNGNSEVTIDTTNSKWSYGSLITENPIVETRLYIQKPDGWSDSINVYIYDENNNKILEWPGIIMENEGGGLYSYTLNLPEEWGNITRVIFNDNKNQVPASGSNGFEIKEGEKKIYKDEQWSDYEIKIEQQTGDVSIIDNTAVVKNPDNNVKVNYDDVIVKNKSNLMSRIKLSLDLYAIKEGGSQEDSTIPPIVDDNINTTIPEGAKDFEVLVGDIDNLNLGYKNGENPLSGNVMSLHSLDVFPKKDDPLGTDRKMVTTGFYNFFNSIKDNEDNYKIIYYKKKLIQYSRKWPLEWQDLIREINSSFYGIVYKNDFGVWTQPSIFYDYLNEDLIPNIINNVNIGNKVGRLNYTYNGNDLYGDRGEIFYDGYVERSITKTNADGKDFILGEDYDSKYIELQPVEPITFNYSDKIGDNEKVYSAVFQVMIDDLQAAASKEVWDQKYDDEDWLISFSPKSKANYKVTLKVVGTNEEIEVEEFSHVINNLSQHGPRANLVTLNLPNKYYELIEKGRKSGLELKIDDTTFGTSGDAYSIDFAKLLVNQKVEHKAEIYGTVIDTDGKPIKNAVVTNSNTGEQVLTDENGNYSFNYVSLGQTIIKVEHRSYETQIKNLYSIYEGSKNEVNFTLSRIYNEEAIAPNTKLTGNVLIERYNSLDEKIGETILTELKVVEAGEENKVTIATEDLLVDPGFYYKVRYDLNLFNMSSIDENSKQFNIRFKSNISAEITQENNK